MRRTRHGRAGLLLPALLPLLWLAPFKPLPFFYDLYTFRGEGGRTEVVAAYAVPVKHLGEEREEWAVRYRFDVTLVLADTALNTVTRTDDSVFVRAPRSLHDDHLLHTHVSVQALPSTSTLHRVTMTDAIIPGRGQLHTAPFAIPDYSGSRLMLSDIALGLPEGEGGWKRGDVSLALLPTSQFPESAFDVYYEIYNMPPGSRYDTGITIERLADRRGRPVEGRPRVTLRFTGESAPETGDALAELRRVESALEEGRYRLTVTVTELDSGRTARRARLFQVRGWGPGATMVPALPRRTGSREPGGR